MGTVKETELTAKQQGKAINKKSKKVFKNILADPFSKFWPEANAQDRKQLSSALNSIYSDVPEESKPTAQREFRKSDHLILGLPKLVNKLTSGEVRAALFSSNLEPKFITRQIMTLALHKNPAITLLVVANLEDLMEKVFGINSYTFGLSLKEDLGPFTAFLECVQGIASKFPPPGQGKPSKSPTVPEVTKKRGKPEPLLTNINFESLYLKRLENGEKAWTPNSSSKDPEDQKTTTKAVKQWSDFISLNDNDDGSESPEGEMDADLEEEKDQLKALLLSANRGKSLKIQEEKQEAMECDDEEELQEDPQEEKPSIFLRPEETSGNQWSSLLKPSRLSNELKKSKKNKKNKKENRLLKLSEGNKSSSSSVPFHPTKIHKVQPNPNKFKKTQKKNKNKKK